MKNKKKELEKWLEACPLPVISRVMDDRMDIHFVAISHFLYEEDTLIVVPLSTLASLLEHLQDTQ